MKLICELDDRTVLGTPGRSEKPPRITVRAIVRDQNDRYALIWSGGWGIHSLPGGGVDAGEDLLTALRREIRELGIVRENRACQDYTQENYYYVVTVTEPAGELDLTDEEREHNVSVGWYPYDELVRLITEPKFERVSCKYFQARDLAALEAYIR